MRTIRSKYLSKLGQTQNSRQSRARFLEPFENSQIFPELEEKTSGWVTDDLSKWCLATYTDRRDTFSRRSFQPYQKPGDHYVVD
jgi:hypothetical protein